MSETVILALIGLLKEWGSLIIPAIGTVVVVWMQRVNNQRSEVRTKSVRSEIDAVKRLSVLSDEQAALMAKGARSEGFDEGVRTAEYRASDLQRLRESFKPESTDRFMARTDGPDQHIKR